MTLYLTRLGDELDELTDKINKLRAFMGEDKVFHKLPSKQKVLMEQQYSVMMEYATILRHRSAAIYKDEQA